MNMFDEMLAVYAPKSQQEQLNALHEVMQQVCLAGLARGGFMEKAAFYGGTCLRIFHGLERFSEDMDFSLLNPDPDFRLEPYFDAVREEFALMGQQVTLTEKKKTKLSAVQSAFLKSETAQYDLQLERGRAIKIKIEVDTAPPLGFATEQQLLLQPYSFYTRCYTLPCLFAGKMHALLFRAWKNRVKGRDWYDFEWYVRKGIPMNWAHFCERARAFNQAGELTPERFTELLRERLSSVPIEQVKADVLPFVRRPSELDIWSTDYFLRLAERMKTE